MVAIRIVNAKKRFQNLWALKGINMEVGQGEFFGLLGPNGAGKTTLIHSMVGLCRLTEGSIQIFDFDSQKEAIKAHALIGFSPQDINLDRFFTIKKILTYQAGFFGTPRKESIKKADHMLELFGLTDKADTQYYKLSGGMQKRLLVAKAVITEPKKVISALKWLMSEMDRRYKLFSEAGVRNIDAYNEMSGFQAMPYIVLFVDELADIMLVSPVEVEDTITRIAQMSRATGIHMVLATQRPSVNIITGLIKANIPCRIAFAVSSQVDSRVILDAQGAEKLLGKGDMLYLPPDQAKPIRIQGANVSDKDINSLVSFMKNQDIQPQYTEEVTASAKNQTVPGIEGDVDELFRKSIELVCQFDKASASLLQRRLSIGYARAARIIDQLEAAGVIGPQLDNSSKGREVLVRSPEEILGNETSESGV